MLWRGFNDWRERRSALHYLKRRQREEELVLLREYPNPMQLVRSALDNGEFEQAKLNWERAQVLLPTTVPWSTETLWILLDLKQYDEAEALMQKRRRYLPNDRFYLKGLAHTAMRRGNFVKAVNFWEHYRKQAEHESEGYLLGGVCLCALDRLDEAEALLAEASRLGFDEIYLWSERARVSERRRDWPESLARWKAVGDRFKFAAGFAGQARALIELGRLGEVEALLEQALVRHVPEQEIAEARTNLVRRRCDQAAVANGQP